MGIIGFGRIGQAAAKLAKAFGMEVMAYDSHVISELEGTICHYTDLESLLKQSDVISLHCPLNTETEGIINKNTIDIMKDGAMLINTSRGPLIVEEDLKEALDCGKLGGAAVDVVSIEPIRNDNPLLTAKNVIITPHIAWAPRESRQRLMDVAVGNLKAFIDGNPQNVVSS